ncbi:hypothetical protein [Truepera radiovictrix]|uniref:Transporter n=1 Tax=Truepera radiovictrix (strain DSM 17093 / CIP 108686 / LMG 22925 / RQ-24) TaxID=649638 RepID=D7CT60_TRURR|nr:hypothetical protein [Truepera radiovictrix]ADI15523.1 putative transporter [Truepera radiovictrix DSM 17093]WMT55926.1 hypothetical protein RCV51_07845 [Truepera radiovictrix]
MLAQLRAFLLEPDPTPAQAAAPLRLLFALAFGGQFGVVALAWLVLALLVTPTPSERALTAQVLLGVTLLELPLALGAAAFVARSGGKEGAMAASIALGVVLAAPAWFALFVWLSGGARLYLAAFLGALALYYLLGWMLAARYSALVETA